MTPTNTFDCPVCKADFRYETRCSRCGTDLSKLMQLIAHSHQLRSKARTALLERRYADAARFAGEAQRLHSTSIGRKMVIAAQALSMVRVAGS
jgi:predicted amidophosphoribosyltransferase